MNRPDTSRPGVWAHLLQQALVLMAHLERETCDPLWTFGGGTVLMLRVGHRQSKDIDLFVPDPQYLGYINPRLSDAALEVSADYEENAEFIKLFLPAGEIDVIVGTALTEHSFDLVPYAGREIRMETCAEIIAKKMWHRGHHAKARDLYDLCAVAEACPQAIEAAGPFLSRHGAAFLAGLQQREAFAVGEFDAIDAIGVRRTFAASLQQAHAILRPWLP